MSDEDPWQGWYQAEQPPGGVPGSDATRDMTISSRMPPAPGNGAGGGRGAWPEQPPPSSPGGPGTPYGGGGRSGGGRSGGSSGGSGGSGYGGGSSGGSGYPGGSGGGSGSGYGGGPGYGPAYGTPTSGGAPARGGGRRWRFWGQPGRRGRRIALIIGVVVIVIIAGVGGTYFWVNGKLNRTVSLPATTVTSAGTNWLIAGSDQRTGISRSERAELHLGADGADASDSLLLLHMGAGKPVLISIPRDSYVPIPGHGSNKINAALAIGGPTLLVQTVESVTGLKIDHYMGIGFGGLADVVNTVGGVRICVKTAIQPDSYSGFKGMAAGCHNLSGTQAIAFVRDRHSFATSDLQRIQDQRAFLSALLSKATSPGVYLNPFTALPFASTAASSIAVDKGTSLYALVQAAFALRAPETGTVPIANANFATSAGDAVLWNQAQALELFNALKAGKPVPAGLLSGTKLG
jgi:LCP family protein required for cell wall assembly